MSVEEQLERMRRNQQASSLREKKRDPLSRSASFNKDNPFILQVITGTPDAVPMVGGCHQYSNLLLLLY